MAVDGAGNLFVTDPSESAVLEITAASGYQNVTPVAGGNSNIYAPYGVAVDGAGNLFVTDAHYNTVLEIPAAGGYTNVIPLANNFNTPQSVAVDGSGNLFVTDTSNYAVKEFYAAGGYSNSNSKSLGQTEGQPSPFTYPVAVALDANDNVYVANNEAGANSVQEILADGGLYDKVVNLATSDTGSFPEAVGIGLDGNGNIFVSNVVTSATIPPVVKLDYADPPSQANLTFATSTNVGVVDSTDPAQTVTVENIGNEPLTFAASSPSYPGNFPENSGDTSTCATASSVVAGASCDISAIFQPTGAGTNAGGVVLTDNALNVETSGVGSAVQNISLAGTGVQTGDTTLVGIVPSSSSLVYGQTESLTATVTDMSTSSSIPTGTVTFTDSVGGSATTLGPVTLVNGVATYPAYTPTAGTHTIMASYTPAASSNFAPSSNTVGTSFTVAAYGTLTSFNVSVATSPVYAGVADAVTVTPVDQYGNAITNYTGPVTLTSSDTAATFGAVTFTSGVGTGTVTFATPGSPTVTATSGAITGTSTLVTVNAPPKYVVTVNTDTTTGTASDCTDQNLSGATPDASCSLRDAIAAANALSAGANTSITFDPTAFAAATTISLAHGQLELSKNATITGATTGSGLTLANLVTVSGNNVARVFQIDASTTVTLNTLILKNGNGGTTGGGGIYVNGGTLTLNQSTVANNAAQGNGGGIANDGGTVHINRSTISGNSVSQSSQSDAQGGGSFNSGMMTVSDSTIVANSVSNPSWAAGVGGGIDNVGKLTIDNSTISGNTTSSAEYGDGGGIYNNTNDDPTFVANNTIISGNTQNYQGDCYTCGTQASNNLIGGTVKLGALASNGGPTQTMLLTSGSTAIGAGTYVAGELTSDQRGVARPSSGAIDAGAVQVSGNGGTITSVSPSAGPLAGGTTVTITGSGFTGATAVYFGTNSVIPTVNSDTSITVTAPAGTAGVVTVAVVTPAGISAANDAATYTYSALTVTAVSPTVALTVGTAASVNTVMVTGGTSPFTYSISPTTLPAGLSFSASTGAITQTPTAASAATNYTVTVTDTNNVTSTASFSLTVNKATPTITTLPTASAITYGQTLTSSTLSGGGGSVAGTFTWTTSSTAPNAGTPSYSITFTPTDTTDYNTATGTVSVTVDKATPTITTPPTASAITYGQTLTSSTLSGGVGSVAGAFAWTTSSTTPGTGTASQPITFTPTDTTDYNTATDSVSVTVNKATPTITTPPTASAITYGKTLASSTLSGGVGSVAGTFAWTTSSTAPGTGTASHSITFTPTDTTNYNTATGSVSVTVNKATPTITTPPTASAITYGQTLSSSTLSGGVGSVAGTFVWTTSSSAPSTGTPSYSITLTPTDTADYNTATVSISVTVNKATPTITTPPTASAITYGQTLASSTLSGGVGSVAGTFAWTTSSTKPTAAGTPSYSVTFTPTDVTDYNTATGSVSLTVNKGTPTLNWSAPAAITYGAALGAGQLDATASVQGAFTYTPAAGAVLQAGNHTLSATFVPTDSTDYNTPTTAVTTTIEVGKATLTITSSPTVSGLAYGAALSSLKLNGGIASANGAAVSGTFTWSAPSTIPGVGTQSYPVTFTPTDTTDYNTVASAVSVSTDQVPTTTGLQSSVGEVMLQSPVTFTATVAISSGSPTGTVNFVDGSAPLGSAPLVNGVASLTVSTLTAGSHTVSAMYSGDGTYAVSNSGTVSETVIDLNTSPTVTGGSSSGGNSAVTVLPGGAANVTLDFTTTLSVTKLPVPATLTVTGLPDGATVGVNPAVWSQTTGTSWTFPAATTLVNPNVAIQLPSLTASNAPQQGSLPGWQKTASATVLLSLLLLPFSRRMRIAGKRLRGGVMLAVLLLAGLVATAGLTGCGASNGFLGQQQKTYNVTMTVTAGTVTRTSNLTLTVQ